MKKVITIKEFCDELIERISHTESIDCCKDELLKFAHMAKDHMGEKEIEVNWVEKP
ncbi:MAG: hypothetical protein OEZ22_13010 [Spirochaetia bacterium]|nr:hypothetical protein [Spirochaetia bacterium]